MSTPRTIASMMHLLACTKDHSAKNSEDCYWYIEEQLEECWAEPDHVPWMTSAKMLVDLFEGDEERVKKSLISLSEACSKITFILGTFKNMESFVFEAVKKTLLP